MPQPGLFGIIRSNRDFTEAETWGKNQFNSSFPAALACYLHSKGLPARYFKTDAEMKRVLNYISIDELYGMDPLGSEIYYSFETQYTPYQHYVVGSIPRNDLVIMSNNQCITSLEIKLVALPDNSTCNFDESHYGSEIVVRPDTIVYLACSFIKMYNDDRDAIRAAISNVGSEIEDWTQPINVLPYLKDIYDAIRRMVREKHQLQMPIIMEPVWKTDGKSPRLSNNCLDVFVWSNTGMLNLFMPDEQLEFTKINRHTRTMVWLFKMLLDYAENGRFNGKAIIDELSYNVKNDKAFSSNGQRTFPLMTCDELRRPRISKDEIKRIILGGGQELLSPERRFDAILYNSPDLFREDNVNA